MPLFFCHTLPHPTAMKSFLLLSLLLLLLRNVSSFLVVTGVPDALYVRDPAIVEVETIENKIEFADSNGTLQTKLLDAVSFQNDMLEQQQDLAIWLVDDEPQEHLVQGVPSHQLIRLAKLLLAGGLSLPLVVHQKTSESRLMP